MQARGFTDLELGCVSNYVPAHIDLPSAGMRSVAQQAVVVCRRRPMASRGVCCAAVRRAAPDDLCRTGCAFTCRLERAASCIRLMIRMALTTVQAFERMMQWLVEKADPNSARLKHEAAPYIRFYFGVHSSLGQNHHRYCAWRPLFFATATWVQSTCGSLTFCCRELPDT